MAEINYTKEKCWRIKEVRPIEISVEPHWTGRGYVLKPKPMTMTYETYEHLDNCHRTEDIAVSYSSYDYEDGDCNFRADSKKDIALWFEKYKGIVKPTEEVIDA